MKIYKRFRLKSIIMILIILTLVE